MIETKATRILNLLSLIGFNRVTKPIIPVDLQNPEIYRFLDLTAKVTSKNRTSKFSIELDFLEEIPDNKMLEVISKDLFSKESLNEIEGLQLDLIEEEILNNLHGKPNPIRNINKVSKKKIKYISRDIQGSNQKISLANIKSVLDLNLAKQISNNMGSGLRKDILNYRTGRFANTTHVDRVQMQRNGAIAIFYSYMKYPYQTFEKGYSQGSPNTRDPRHLISKSIHEIASKLVFNKLRAIRI